MKTKCYNYVYCQTKISSEFGILNDDLCLYCKPCVDSCVSSLITTEIPEMCDICFEDSIVFKKYKGCEHKLCTLCYDLIYTFQKINLLVLDKITIQTPMINNTLGSSSLIVYKQTYDNICKQRNLEKIKQSVKDYASKYFLRKCHLCRIDYNQYDEFKDKYLTHHKIPYTKKYTIPSCKTVFLVGYYILMTSYVATMLSYYVRSQSNN